MSCALIILLVALATANAQVSPIRLRVEQQSKSDTTSYKSIQSRSLTVHLTNSAPQPADVIVKWAVLGRDIKSKDIVTVEQGEMKSSMKASGGEKLQTPVAKPLDDQKGPKKK